MKKKNVILSDEEKDILEEFLYRKILSQKEHRSLARVLRWIHLLLVSDHRRLTGLPPLHVTKIMALKNDKDFMGSIFYQIVKITGDTQVGTRRLPSSLAEDYWRVLELCKNSLENYEWFRNYTYANGELQRRLGLTITDLGFSLPSIPSKAQVDTDWARQLKKNMLMTASVVDPRFKVKKSHDRLTRALEETMRESNPDFFKLVKEIISEEKETSFENREASEEGYWAIKIINLFLDRPYRNETDLSQLAIELGIPDDFTY